MQPLAAIILAAGKSRRMQSDVPKVLHAVLGRPLIEYVVLAARSVGAERIAVVVSPEHRQAIADVLAPYDEVGLVVQEEPKGTGHAVAQARDLLGDFTGTGLVLLGDAPCVSARSLEAVLAGHRERGATVSLLSGEVADPTGYGRVVRGLDGDLAAVVEEKDADAAHKEIREINSGVFALELPKAFALLEHLVPSPQTGELYVTQVIELARSEGLRTIAVSAAEETDVLGVNDRLDLAQVTRVLQRRVNETHMRSGVTIVDPASAFIDARAELQHDVRIEPFTVIEGPCLVERGAVIGPFAHLRAARVGAGSRVGNFVEVVRSEVGAEGRALHLAYIGDAALGERVNVGAGTVFANWDGRSHQRSQVGAGASLGANTVVVGPSRLGEGSRTGAGSVVAKAEVPPGATWVGVPARPVRPAGEGGRA